MHFAISFGLEISASIVVLFAIALEVPMKNSIAFFTTVKACVWCGIAFLRSLWWEKIPTQARDWRSLICCTRQERAQEARFLLSASFLGLKSRVLNSFPAAHQRFAISGWIPLYCPVATGFHHLAPYWRFEKRKRNSCQESGMTQTSWWLRTAWRFRGYAGGVRSCSTQGASTHCPVLRKTKNQTERPGLKGYDSGSAPIYVKISRWGHPTARRPSFLLFGNFGS